MFWGDELRTRREPAQGTSGQQEHDAAWRDTTRLQKLQALADASSRLKRDFGWSSVPWAKSTASAHFTGDRIIPFSDAAPSIPCRFASAPTERSPRSARPRSRVREKMVRDERQQLRRGRPSSGSEYAQERSTAGGRERQSLVAHFNDEAGAMRRAVFGTSISIPMS
jgi:hypothetical protein